MLYDQRITSMGLSRDESPNWYVTTADIQWSNRLRMVQRYRCTFNAWIATIPSITYPSKCEKL
jgi:hypothetical protein